MKANRKRAKVHMLPTNGKDIAMLSKRGPFNKPMIFKTIKEGFEYFTKFNKPKQRR
jgi:hypothetical protein